jgi:hypothetical protein
MHTSATLSESRIRRTAQKLGLIVKKSRSRDPDAIDYGDYWVLDGETGVIIFPSGVGGQIGASLDDVAEFLHDYARR